VDGSDLENYSIIWCKRLLIEGRAHVSFFRSVGELGNREAIRVPQIKMASALRGVPSPGRTGGLTNKFSVIYFAKASKRLLRPEFSGIFGSALHDKHHRRKHGLVAYYGQPVRTGAC
jgi:hypothetical protein